MDKDIFKMLVLVNRRQIYCYGKKKTQAQNVHLKAEFIFLNAAVSYVAFMDHLVFFLFGHFSKMHFCPAEFS